MTNTRSVYITHAKRTAVGAFLSKLQMTPAHLLGATVVKALLNESNIPSADIDEVIIGQVITSGSGQNPARQTAIAAGIPKEVPALTINKVCGSGLKSICLAADAILTGNSQLVIAGGQENMSLGKHGIYIRRGHTFGNNEVIDLMQYDGLTDVFSGNLMGITAENIATQFNIDRQMQDRFAVESHRKAYAAQQAGYFQNEIVPMEVTSKKQVTIFNQDECIRADTNIDILGKLHPVFKSDGTVTAGNASPINDGAAAVVVASEEAVKKYNLTPLIRIVSYAQAGVDPNIMGTGPVPAARKALKKAGWTVADLDIIECNEAFAAQAICVNQQMQWDVSKVNVCGGAIALGHPIGAAGARILVTLLHQMQRQNARKGLATLCIGGGMGIAMCVAAL